ncbi:alpha/beta fold hydrolase [Lentzea sp. HUAS12]|uniref:alpha/beta fold hydrolase n=1 Tax=Lentzea sp. HUAS12 TaxID=2951806 RepID=UPI00209F7FA7|nr:alpha/beta hydrolase [Lentzea sp. HUAS12]USX56344.1 alpha/beta hydrolase [Lentzea sp. HUAS12]
MNTAAAHEPRTIVLLHGFPQSSLCWNDVQRSLRAAGHHTVAPDLRGYTPHDRPAEQEAYRSEAIADCLISTLEHLGTPVDLVGHDWGGGVAWHIALRRPDLLRSLTAVSTPHPAAYTRALREDPEQRRKSEYIKFFTSADATDQLLADNAAGLRAVFSHSRMSAELISSYVGPLSTPAALNAALAWYHAVDGAGSQPPGRCIVPTCYLWGDSDEAFSHAAAEGTAALVEGPYTFRVLRGGSHWLPDENPDEVASAVLELIASTTARPSGGE